jgi:hypothetical protein
MTRQVALLLALGALAAAAALVSFGSWILLRRGSRREGTGTSPGSHGPATSTRHPGGPRTETPHP